MQSGKYQGLFYVFQDMKDQMANQAMSLSDKKSRQVCTDLSSKLIELFDDSVFYADHNVDFSLLQAVVCKSVSVLDSDGRRRVAWSDLATGRR